MAKKRKAGSRPDGHSRDRTSEDDSKRTITTYEDVADSEDEFFINRDKILLDEGPAQKKRRKVEEEGDCPVDNLNFNCATADRYYRCIVRTLG